MLDPFRNIALNMAGRILDLAGGKSGQHVGAWRLGREFIAVKFGGQCLRRQAPLAKSTAWARAEGLSSSINQACDSRMRRAS